MGFERDYIANLWDFKKGFKEGMIRKTFLNLRTFENLY